MKKMTLGQYLPGDSLIHRLDPRTKLIGCMAVIITILVNDHWLGLCIITLFIAMIIIMAKIDVRAVLRGVKWLWLLLTLTFFFQAILTEGDPLFHLGPMIFSQEGLSLGIITVLRLLILYLSSTILTMTTSSMKLAGGMEALLSPLSYLRIPVYQLAMLINVSLRFIPTIIEEAETISRAQKSRGAPFNSPKRSIQLRAALAVLIPLIAASLQRATDLAAAMESRCYTGGANQSRLKNLHYGTNDFMAFMLIVMVCILPCFYF